MQIKFHYPMLGIGTVKQSGRKKIGLIVSEHVIDLENIPEDEAPMAMVFGSTKQTKTQVRYHNGSHYRAFPKLDKKTLVADESGTVRFPGLTRRLGKIVGDEMQRQLFKNTVVTRDDYYPAGAGFSGTVAGLQSGRVDLSEWVKPSGAFAFEEGGVSEAGRWKTLAERAADCLIMVDGEIWERCEEPVYKVSTVASHGLEVVGGKPFAAVGFPPLLAETDPDERMFSALERDEALQVAREALIQSQRGYDDAKGFIEVVMPSAVHYRSAEGEMRRLVRMLILDVERELAAAAKDGAGWSDKFPVTLVAAWNELRNVEPIFDEPGGHERVEEAVLALVSLMKPFEDLRNAALRDEDVDALLARWDDREIALSGQSYATPTPH